MLKNSLVSLFWPQLDYIGISGYFPLATDKDTPSVQDLAASWANVRDTKIKPISQQHGKPVLFTEIGYKSANGAHYEPWNYDRNQGYNAEEQRKLYEALFSFWNNESYLHGVHIWEWSSDPAYGVVVGVGVGCPAPLNQVVIVVCAGLRCGV